MKKLNILKNIPHWNWDIVYKELIVKKKNIIDWNMRKMSFSYIIYNIETVGFSKPIFIKIMEAWYRIESQK